LPCWPRPGDGHAVALFSEDAGAYEELVRQHIVRFRPGDPVEARIVMHIAAMDWQWERNQAIQTRLIQWEMRRQTLAGSPLAELIPELNRVASAWLSLCGNAAFRSLTRVTAQMIGTRKNLIKTLVDLRKHFAYLERNDCSVPVPEAVNVAETPAQRGTSPKKAPRPVRKSHPYESTTETPGSVSMRHCTPASQCQPDEPATSTKGPP
jgi:hypothetical protein